MLSASTREHRLLILFTRYRPPTAAKELARRRERLMRLTNATNYATPAMEITHVVSSDSLDLPHVVMQDDGS